MAKDLRWQLQGRFESKDPSKAKRSWQAKRSDEELKAKTFRRQSVNCTI
jgi:hypothetical protein